MKKIDKKKKNVIFITSCMGKGGTQRVICNLANYFINEYEVSILKLFSDEMSYDIDKRINILDFSCNDRKKIIQIPILIIKLRDFFKKLNKEDTVILSFLTKVNLFVLLSKIGIDIPVIISERNDPKYDGRNVIIRFLCNITYPYADKIVFQTKYAKSQFNNTLQKNGVVISNPIIIKESEVLKDDEEIVEKDIIVSVGRLIPQKNQKLLIEAFSELSMEFKDIKLIIYGEGNLRKDLQLLINNLNIANRVSLPGVVDDIHKKMKQARCFILSSDYEGQSNAILEAMSLGLPCITTNCSGISEIINERNGVLIDVGNKQQLIEKMRRILKDKKYAKRIGEEARKSANNLTLEKIAYMWEMTFNN